MFEKYFDLARKPEKKTVEHVGVDALETVSKVLQIRLEEFQIRKGIDTMPNTLLFWSAWMLWIPEDTCCQNHKSYLMWKKHYEKENETKVGRKQLYWHFNRQTDVITNEMTWATIRKPQKRNRIFNNYVGASTDTGTKLHSRWPGLR